MDEIKMLYAMVTTDKCKEILMQVTPEIKLVIADEEQLAEMTTLAKNLAKMGGKEIKLVKFIKHEELAIT